MYKTIFKAHSKLLKALSHEKRLEIIHLLRDQKLNVTQIQKMLDLPQANLSQHLQVLREAGVLNSRRDGKNIYYSIAHKNFIKASDLLREILIEKHKGTELEDQFTLKMTDLTPITHDPACQMRLSPKTASFACSYKNKNYYFCAEGCLKKFKENPAKYVKENK